MSVVSAMRPMEFLATLSMNASSFPARNSSVRTGPGATTLAVIPFAATSLARILVIASTAALLATYAPYPGGSAATVVDENATMRPPLCAGMRRAASRHTRNLPRVFTANVASKSSTARGVLGVEDARAGHHDVGRGAERLLGAVEERAHGVRVGDVRAHGHGAEAPRGELRYELVGLGRVGGVVHHDARAERGEVGGHLAPDATGAAGDERDAAFERERRG
nr:unnamed protein product [Digitaria exilis]